MRDRVVQHPNRYKLTPVSEDVYDLTPEPGIVTEEGTDLNKANLLSSTTETALEAWTGLTLPDDPTVDDALDLISNGQRIATGSYTGTGGRGSENPNSLAFDFAPKVVLIAPVDATYMNVWLIWFRGSEISIADYYSTGPHSYCICSFSSSTNTLSWYAPMTGEYAAPRQLNESGKTYKYLAL